MRFIKVINGLSMLFALVIISASALFAFVVLTPVKVLKDWHLGVVQQDYHPGDDITVLSTFNKVRNASGTSYRFLECTNPVNGNQVRYPIDQSDGSRPASFGSAQLLLHIPDSIPNLPISCHINITVVYNVYSFRKVTQTAITNNFQVIK